MHLGNKLANLVGDRTLDAMSKFMGLLLAAFGIEFIKNGIISIVK